MEINAVKICFIGIYDFLFDIIRNGIFRLHSFMSVD